MLSDERKQEIVEEESFRLSLRRELEPPANDKLTAWKFLNSNVGLLLLSSVLIGSLSWGYNQIRDYRNARTENQEIVRKLRIELAFRAQNVSAEVPQELKWDNFYDYMFIFDGTRKGWIPQPVYPEFQDRTVSGLTYELLSRAPEEDKALVDQHFQSSLQVSRVLKDLMRVSIQDEREGEQNLRPEDIERLQESVALFVQLRSLAP